MSFAFVRVTGTAARVPGTGENSSERRMEQGQHKEKPLKPAGFQRLREIDFLEIFRWTLSEYSVVVGQRDLETARRRE